MKLHDYLRRYHGLTYQQFTRHPAMLEIHAVWLRDYKDRRSGSDRLWTAILCTVGFLVALVVVVRGMGAQ